MTDFHDKPCHSKSDLVEDPNKPQEGSRKTSFAFVSDIYIYVCMYVSTLFTANFIYYRGWQEVTGENFKVA